MPRGVVTDEEWLPIWKDLTENQGWRFERVTKSHPGGHWNQDFYLPPGIVRGAPGLKSGRDFFDNKAAVLNHLQSSKHQSTAPAQQQSAVALEPAAASAAASGSTALASVTQQSSQSQGDARVHPDWHCLPSPTGPFWWNSVTQVRQWEVPAFLFSPKVAIAPGATACVSNPYNQSTVLVSFPDGCKPGEWYSVPTPPAQTVASNNYQPTVVQQQQQLLQQQQQQLLQHQQANQRAMEQIAVHQKLQQRQAEYARQQAAAEEARIQEELEYQADDPDSDLANAADVEIYESYVPQKLRIGRPHPDPVVEAACLSTVASPDVSLELQIYRENHPAATALSALQLEAVTYACQRYELTLQDGARAGFFIGDGAGMGKGREIAGLLAENWLQGRRKSLWVSISSDLKIDAERDLSDCGISGDNLTVVPLNKCPYGKLKLDDSTVLFTTYSSLVAKKQGSGRWKNRSRLHQIVTWLGDDFDGCIIFDECHKSKNLIPTAGSVASRTGLAVVELQEKLPKARVLYCSATGASEPRNMGYMVRLGLWGKGTAYPDGFKEFLSALERRGVGAMELLAMEMKRMGLYVCRTLSYAGSSFSMREEKLTSDQQATYDAAVRFLQRIRHEVEDASEAASTVAADIDEVDEVANELDSESDSDEEVGLAGKAVWRYFWGQHQRFFMSLCAAMKVPSVVRAAKSALDHNKCAIIGIQSTGEASTKQVLEETDGDDLDDFISAPTVILERLIEKTFILPPKPLALKQEEREERMQELIKKRQEEAAESSGLGKRQRRATYKVSYAEAGSDDFSDDSESAEDFEEGQDDDSEDYEEDMSDSEKKRGKATDEEIAKRDAAIKAATDAYLQAKQKKMALLEEARRLSLPTNPLDELIDQLGGVTKVAEMTGRSGRFVRLSASSISPAEAESAPKRPKTDDQAKKESSSSDANVVAPPGVRYEKRNADGGSLETANLRERDAFNNGEKFVAIISDAASAGISLHADRRFKNQRRRVHVTLELPWSADKAVQQLGRSHRSNQIQPPEYIFCFTEIGGERRVASAVAKRLQSLGALTHGDRRATAGGSVSSLEAYNWDTKQGRDALTRLYRSIAGQEKPIAEPPKIDDNGKPLKFLNAAREWLTEVGLEKEAQGGGSGKASDQLLKEMGRFLNRILGLEVAQQDAILEYFGAIYEHKLREARRDGATDECVLELCGRHVRRVADEVVFRCPLSHAETRHVTFEVDRGISWEEASTILEDAQKAGDSKDAVNGFYSMDRKGFRHVLLAVECLPAPGDTSSTKPKKKNRTIRVLRPSTGEHTNQAGYILSRYTRINEAKAKKLWETIFESTATTCMHGKKCKIGADCEAGKRLKSVHLLTDSTLPLWATVEQVLRDVARARTFSVVRVLQTEALAAQDDEGASPLTNDDGKDGNAGAQDPRDGEGKAAGGDGDADDTDAVEGADAAAATTEHIETTPEKVIGINLPKKHASAILEAIQKLDGGVK